MTVIFLVQLHDTTQLTKYLVDKGQMQKYIYNILLQYATPKTDKWDSLLGGDLLGIWFQKHWPSSLFIVTTHFQFSRC